MRRFASLIVGIFTATVVVLWLSQLYQGAWEPRLHALIEKQGEAFFGAPTHIQKIQYVFPHRVRLSDVRIEPFFRAQDVTLGVDLLDVLPALVRKRPIESFGVVQVRRPYVALSSPTVQGLQAHFRTSARPSRKKMLPIFLTIVWEQGTVNYNGEVFQDVQGAYRLRGPQQRFAMRAKSNAGNVRFQFSTLGRRWNAQAYLRDAEINSFLTTLEVILQQPLRAADWTLKGPLQADLQFQGREKPFLSRWPQYLSKMEVRLQGGELLLPHSTYPVNAKALLRGSGNDLLLEDGRIEDGTNIWKVTGRAHHWNPAFEMELRAALPKGRWKRYEYRNASLGLLYKQKVWTLQQTQVEAAGGRLQASGTFKRDALDIRLTAADLSLSELMSPSKPSASPGRLNLALAVDGPPRDWQLRGSWWAEHLRTSARNTDVRWHGAVEGYRSGDFLLKGESDDKLMRAHVRGTIDNAQFTLSDITWMTPTQAFLNTQAKGRWSIDMASIQISGRHRPTAESTPVPFDAQATLQAERLSITRFSYQLPKFKITAHARADLAQPAVAFDAAVNVVPTYGDAVPLTLKGRTWPGELWRGEASVHASTVTVQGRTYEPVSAALRWNPEGLQIQQVRYGKAVTGSAEWRWDSPALNCQAELKLDRFALSAWLPSSSTVSGVLQFKNACHDLEAKGTYDPDGQFAFSMVLSSGTSLTDFPFRWTIQQGTVRSPETRVSFKPGAVLEFPEKKRAALHAALEVRNLKAGFFKLFGNFDLDASWSGEAQSPILEARARTRSLYINDYELEEGQIVAHYEGGLLRFYPPAQPPTLISGTIDLRARPQLRFDHFVIAGLERQRLDLHGQIGPRLWDFALRGQQLDLSALSSLAGFSLSASGTADVSIRGTGDTRHPHMEGTAKMQEGRIAGMRYKSGESEFLWQDDRITFRRLRLSDPGRYTLIGTGVVPIRSRAAPTERINFSLRLENTNLGILESAFSEIQRADGDVEGILQVQGTWDEPRMSGRLRIENGDIVGAHYFRRLKSIFLSADFDGNRLRVQELRGQSGKGEFLASGDVQISGFEPIYYDLQAAVISKKPLEVQIPELAIPDSPLAKRFRFLTSATRTDVAGRLSLKGPTDAPTFTGVLALSNGHFTFPPPVKKPAPAGWIDWTHRTFWDVQLTFAEGVWFENELVQANLNGGLVLKGHGDKLDVDGGMSIPQGRISYLGLQFDIQEARFDLKNNVPYLRGIAESKITATDTIGGTAGGVTPTKRFDFDDTITLTIDYAPLAQIKPRLTSASNPSMPQEKVLARITRTDTENLTTEERNYLFQKQVVSLIDNSLATPFAQNVLKRTGLADRLRVEHVMDPSAAPPVDPVTGQATRGTTAGDLFANTKYTVEKDVIRNLSLGYGMRFVPRGETAVTQKGLDLVSDVQMSYRAFKNIYIRGSMDLPNQVQQTNPLYIPEQKATVEQRWRFGWWGNTNKDKLKPKNKEKSKDE